MNDESRKSETTFEDIKRVLWAGADTFRGVIDAANYKEYVLSMLLIKYLDDTFAEAVEGLERKYAGNELRVSRAIRNLPFRLEDNVRFRFLFERRFDDKIGALSNEALRSIEDLNVELRSHLFWKINGALFVDAGNIWTIRKYEDQPEGEFRFDKFYRQIAVSYGLGLRLALDFFTLRFDAGMKAINPAYEGRDHYPIWHPNLSRDFAFHFAVGLPF